ncbi:hypothetical protein BC2230_10376 [Burkholderia cepacia]
MMRAILSNDDREWHSHLEQSVKELGLDWQAGFFMIGSPSERGCGGAQRAWRDRLNAPPGGRLRPIPEYRGNAAAGSWRQGRIAFLRPGFPYFLIPFGH